MLIKPEVNTQTEVETNTQEQVAVEQETKAVEQSSTEVEVVEQTQPTTSVTAKHESSIKAFQAEQAELGYEGLEIGAFSFDGIKLHEGQFKLGADETELGQEFEFITMSTRNRYVVRQGEFNDAETFYSYSADGSTLTDGSSSAAILEEWKEDGYGTEDSPLDIRKYLEVMAEIIVDDEEHNGSIVNLSIPPSSLQRFGGAARIAKARYRAILGEVVIRASVGSKVGEGQKAFRPWNFKVARKLA